MNRPAKLVLLPTGLVSLAISLVFALLAALTTGYAIVAIEDGRKTHDRIR